MTDLTREQKMEFIGLHLVPNAQFSDLIIEQLYYGLVERTIHIGSVLDVMKQIQCGCVKTKKGIQDFKHEPLEGFSHAHWTEARFILKNLLNHWQIDSDPPKKLDKMIEDVCCEEGIGEDDPLSEKTRSKIDYNLFNAYFERREEGRLTGEWIVFRKGEKTIFLCLAKHRSNLQGDRELYLNMARTCSNEFPELFPKNKTEHVIREQTNRLETTHP